jgi:hypothetical protein
LRAAIGVDAEDTCEHPKYGIVRLEPVVIARVRSAFAVQGFSPSSTHRTFGLGELAQNVTSGALHAQAIWRHHRTPPVDMGVYRYQSAKYGTGRLYE